MSHAAAVHATMQAMHAQMPPAHLVAASPAMNSPVGSAASTNNNASQTTNGTSSLGSSGSTAPCSTLFVANLGQFVSEQELKDAFSR